VGDTPVGPRGTLLLESAERAIGGVDVAMVREQNENLSQNLRPFWLAVEVVRLHDGVDPGAEDRPIDLVAKDRVLLQKIDDVIDVLAPVDGRLLGETKEA